MKAPRFIEDMSDADRQAATFLSVGVIEAASSGEEVDAARALTIGVCALEALTAVVCRDKPAERAKGMRAMAADLERLAGEIAPDEPQTGAVRRWPERLTPELGEVLGMMVFETCPIAHAFRAAGRDIAPKTEAEQAFVLHWLIGVALEHGANWRAAAGQRLWEIVEVAKAAGAPA